MRGKPQAKWTKSNHFWTEMKALLLPVKYQRMSLILFFGIFKHFPSYIDWECRLFSPYARLWYTMITYEPFEMLLLFILLITFMLSFLWPSSEVRKSSNFVEFILMNCKSMTISTNDLSSSHFSTHYLKIIGV